MVVAKRLKSELLPVGPSDNGVEKGKAALNGAGAPGSSQTPNQAAEAARTTQRVQRAHSVESSLGVHTLVSSQPWSSVFVST